MPAILLTWAAVIPVLTGLGLLIQRLYGVRRTGSSEIVRGFWVGFAVCLAVAQSWSLFWPVDWRIGPAILALGAVGLLWSRRSLLRFAREVFQWPSPGLFALIVLLLLAVRIAVSAAQEVPFPDTGSYHLPATLWAHSYAVVPGLSNPHCRLGFNSSLFPYAAAFAEGPWHQRPHHVVMGVQLVVFVAVSLVGATRLSERGRPEVANILAASFFAPAAYLLLLGGRVSSLSPNTAIALLILVAAWQIVTVVTSQRGLSYQRGYAALCAVLFLVTATTIKVTVAPFAAASLIILWLSGERGRDGACARTGRKPLSWLVIFIILLAVPWLIRGVVTSGYPLYPLATAGIDADWRVPEEQAALEAEWTKSFARRSFDRPAQGYDWVGRWASGVMSVLGFSVPFATFLAAVLCVPLLRILPCSSPLERLERRALLMMGPAAVALVAWFITAPDPRFAMGYIWLLACLAGSCVLARVWRCAGRAARFAVFATVATIIVAEAVWSLRQFGPSVLTACRDAQAGGLMDALTCGLRPSPAGEFRTYVTSSGLQLQVPTYGNGIWDAPLLSTPHPSPNLRLRDPNDISRGFLSDGPWKPLRFPNEWDGFQHYVAERLDFDPADELSLE